MSWTDVVACTRSWFTVVIETEEFVGISWEGARIKIVRTEVLGRSFVAVIGDALDASALDPSTVLALNHALSIGAFEIEDQRLLLRAMLPVTGLDEVDLRRVILHVCRQVAHVQRKVSETPASAHDPATFLHYAD